MDYRSFEGFDVPTTENLRTLERRSQQKPDGDAEALQQMLMLIIGIHEVLPKPMQALIKINRCYIGDRHFDMTQEQQHQSWHEINDDLSAGLDRVVAEQDRLLADPAALADRPETQGERVLGLCAQLKFAGWDVGLAKQLQRAGAGSEVVGDAKKLEALFSRRNIPDIDAHEREISDLIGRIKEIAHRLHHRRVFV
jgi:hypothetical protein